MRGVGFEKTAESCDGFVLFPVSPLAIGEEEHGAAGSVGLCVVAKDCSELVGILRFVESGTSAFLPAGLDAAVNDESGGTYGEQDGEGDDSLLVAIEECLEGIGPLRNLGKRDGSFFRVGGHNWKFAELRERDQSGSGVEINAEVGKFVDLIVGEVLRGVEARIFHGHCRAVWLASARMSKRIYVVAGELSGDAHGAGLLRSLRGKVPGLEVRGAGGPEMGDVAGAGLRDWVEDAAVMGVWEVLKRYPWFRARFAEMLAEVQAFQPDVLLLIDYPGFNLRFAAAVKRACPQTKIVYYISPQVWAWNKGRIPKMVKLLDEMLCLFPFEQPIFQNAGLKTTFVGHPLVDELEGRRISGVKRDLSLIGLFPGSREREVARLFPVMIETAQSLKAAKSELCFEVPAASPRLEQQIRGLLAEAGAGDLIQVTAGGSHSLMQRACCAVIASGTATLEAAYYGLPYCLVYRMAWSTYMLGRMLVKIEHIGLVNILAGRGVVEEYIQDAAEPGAISRSLLGFVESPERREALQVCLAETAAKLGGEGAHDRAALAVAGWFAVE